MTLTRNQKIGIAIGGSLLLGTIIYFAFIRKTDAITEAVMDPTLTGGTSGGQGGQPAGAPAYKPYVPPANETADQALARVKAATQGRG